MSDTKNDIAWRQLKLVELILAHKVFNKTFRLCIKQSDIPSKHWLTKIGQSTADFTPAQTQLADWKTWFHNLTHQHLFFEYYEINTEYRRGKAITCKRTSEGYVAKNILPTFRWGPVFAEKMSKIKGKEEARLNSAISKERKKFFKGGINNDGGFG